jgi:hypothetical protein
MRTPYGAALRAKLSVWRARADCEGDCLGAEETEGGQEEGCSAEEMSGFNPTARAGNRRFWCLSALRAHTKAPYKTDLHRKTLMALNCPRRPGQESGSAFERADVWHSSS